MEIRERFNNDMNEHLDKTEAKVHPWRRCGRGRHLVREHIVHVHPSKTHPGGEDVTWHEHCANNPSGKNELSFIEIQYISHTYFSNLEGAATVGALKKFTNESKYDNEIRGWVKYWNDIFKQDDPLHPNVVKALIATESSFEEQPKGQPNAHGLMQIIGASHQYLGGAKNELRDYFVCVSVNELVDPTVNICAGVRWLFRKKQTATGLLKRKATWEETVEDYKAILSKRINKEKYNEKPMNDFRDYYKILTGK